MSGTGASRRYDWGRATGDRSVVPVLSQAPVTRPLVSMIDLLFDFSTQPELPHEAL